MATVNRDNTRKKDIAKNILANIGTSFIYASKIIDDLINILICNLFLNELIKIKNFGTFKVQKKNKRIGRNPKNKKNYEISERNIISFKTAEELKKKINNNVKK